MHQDACTHPTPAGKSTRTCVRARTHRGIDEELLNELDGADDDDDEQNELEESMEESLETEVDDPRVHHAQFAPMIPWQVLARAPHTFNPFRPNACRHTNCHFRAALCRHTN